MMMIVVSAWMSETTDAGKSTLHLISVASNWPHSDHPTQPLSVKVSVF